jgi:hypothetical protein
MEFIKCRKCKRPISDQVRRCPSCGTPVGKKFEDGASSKRGGKALTFTVLAVAGAALVAYVNGWIPGRAAPPPAEPHVETPLPRVDTKFGLTEDKRREVYEDLVRAEDHAQVEADRRYPPPDTGASDVRWKMHAEMREHFRKQVDEEDRKAVAKRYGLSSEQLQAIGAEGVEKSWPRPARQSIR